MEFRNISEAQIFGLVLFRYIYVCLIALFRGSFVVGMYLLNVTGLGLIDCMIVRLTEKRRFQ